VFPYLVVHGLHMVRQDFISRCFKIAFFALAISDLVMHGQLLQEIQLVLFLCQIITLFTLPLAQVVMSGFHMNVKVLLQSTSIVKLRAFVILGLLVQGFHMICQVSL
jgi:hypothetical protein